jgi:hypothetical protein
MIGMTRTTTATSIQASDLRVPFPRNDSNRQPTD